MNKDFTLNEDDNQQRVASQGEIPAPVDKGIAGMNEMQRIRFMLERKQKHKHGSVGDSLPISNSNSGLSKMSSFSSSNNIKSGPKASKKNTFQFSVEQDIQEMFEESSEIELGSKVAAHKKLSPFAKNQAVTKTRQNNKKPKEK